ncbi:Dak2p [Sugiyamaella lignohabitans]|uniref:Dak2p n=1 Tax=Sugiyamaella lignohabitans TaxID=796027 RepID=A0A161HHZ4_9ASCO|nr:Dak2p [Sugiyamaella lignohabitans]ANB15800.1 Dak2p [Sugiyamaella lignohabitans]
MSTKQFDYPSGAGNDIVLPALRALVQSSPWLKLIPSERVVYRTSETPKVSLISGGGSGHEPTHAGFVGTGLLDAAVAGHIFASPSTKQISAGLKAVEDNNGKGNKGSLIIVKNYTGDVLHFGLVAERAKARGSKVELVVVADDVSVGRTQGGLVGRRGLAGTVLVHKIAGAASQEGLELDEVAKIARSVIANTVTIAASLDHCSVPGRHFETNLNSNEIEIGMGIHNEPGMHKQSPIPSVEKLVCESLLPLLVDQNDKERSFVGISASDDLVLMVNNLGSISNLEILYIADVTLQQLKKKYNIVPKRIAVGAYITAMNGPGFSLTLLNASRAQKDISSANILNLFDQPAKASGWNQVAVSDEWKSFNVTNLEVPSPEETETNKHRHTKSSSVSADPDLFAEYLTSGIKQVLKEEPAITEYDTVAGDGDCGETLAAGGNAILAAIKGNDIRLDDGINALTDISDIVEDSMGGTSGGLYSIFLSALAQGVALSNSEVLDRPTLAFASKHALERLYVYTKARVGGRTLIDALDPFVHALGDQSKTFAQAVQAAVDGANKTRQLEAKFGRASYVSREELKKFDSENGLPDPGAIGLAALLKGFADVGKN